MTSTWYCALLRGIGPGNPNMRNEKLREVFDGLGFTGVVSVLSSGNIVFATETTDTAALEDRIQSALRGELGIGGGTIVRSRTELQALADGEPFGDLEHTRETYLTATFLKSPLDPVPTSFPETGDPTVRMVGYDTAARAVLAVSDNTSSPFFMTWLERQFGKDITTRTWLTVHRILKRMPDHA
ncbi:uncharacterized protein (DUF1697 family) [Prauserella sediminis]|uniref:Uncharacterized protein (DUF1697 family) n=1 Tax=Prauserella sediminis TaxID=577680 RepID=A0A839XR02_9PSEU|nr:DUF1697 domain-containing protein [Prauserella sediminis]MBB3663348.1 uncharacterized protein (DUF1697 family) [Prauserella sediminis]